jgi:hypothetical protein
MEGTGKVAYLTSISERRGGSAVNKPRSVSPDAAIHGTIHVAVACLVMVVLLGSVAAAATVKPLAFSDLVGKSDLIVTARAVSIHSQWEDGGRTIRTRASFALLSVLKGVHALPSLTLRLDGGAVGDARVQVSGMPRFEVGKRYLLFVRGNGKHISPITGFNQGVFEIIEKGGKTVLITRTGHEWVGVADDRLVLAARPRGSSSREPAPIAVPVLNAAKPAHPEAARLEAEWLRRMAHGKAPALPPRAPVSGTADSSHGGKVSAPPRRVQEPADREPRARDVRPILLAPDADQGRRITVQRVTALIQSRTRKGGER